MALTGSPLAKTDQGKDQQSAQKCTHGQAVTGISVITEIMTGSQRTHGCWKFLDRLLEVAGPATVTTGCSLASCIAVLLSTSVSVKVSVPLIEEDLGVVCWIRFKGYCCGFIMVCIPS